MMSVPKFYQKILHWALPESIREPILGDLEEEFHLLASQDVKKARQWYLHQALSTSWRFMWRAQKGVIMFLLSLFVFCAMTFMGMHFGFEPSAYFDVPSAMITLIPALFFALACTSIQSFKDGLRGLFNDEVELEPVQLQSAQQFFKVLGNVSMLMGVFTSILGAIAMSANIEAEVFSSVFGPALAVCLLSLLYGVGFKVLSYVAEQKLQFKASQL